MGRLLLVLLTAAALHAIQSTPVLAAGPIEELGVVGEVIESGIYDPSIEYSPDGSVGWMLYSSVEGPAFPFGPIVETHVARSLDHGATWTLIGEVNPSVPGTETIEGNPVDGSWNHEVASLVHDPDDPGAEWKHFAHSIFFAHDPNSAFPTGNYPPLGWISYRTATDPGGTWSTEVALFGSNVIPFPPYSAQINLNALDPNLADLLTYSEPGAFYTDGTLYLSLTGLLATGPERIVLIASDDHGATWDFVRVLLTKMHAAALGFVTFDGTAIAEQGGRVFLLASPESAQLVHDGTAVFEFQDLAQGQLHVDGADVPIVRNRFLPQPNFASTVGGGQADFHLHNTNGGLVMPQLNLSAFPGDPQIFHIYQYNETLLEGLPVPSLGAFAIAASALSLLLLARSRLLHRKL